MQEGATLIDIRSESQRFADGSIPGARVVARNVLEWRLDPVCPFRDTAFGRVDARPVLLCHEGYQSSLAAYTAQRFGIVGATDVIGGFRGRGGRQECRWRASARGLTARRIRAFRPGGSAVRARARVTVGAR